MRVERSVARAGSLQPSTAADLLERFRLAGGDPDRLVMVGGGAGLHWLTAVVDDDPAVAETPLRTRDIDFQFDRTENDTDPTAIIETFASAIGGRVSIMLRWKSRMYWSPTTSVSRNR